MVAVNDLCAKGGPTVHRMLTGKYNVCYGTTQVLIKGIYIMLSLKPLTSFVHEISPHKQVNPKENYNYRVNEFRAFIKILTKKGKPPWIIINELDVVHRSVPW